jgi:hypothetical protein
MSEFELAILLREFGSVVAEQFNFWMATTFALVIASHTAGHRLNRISRFVLIVLYIAACSVYYLRYQSAVQQIIVARNQLIAMDSEFSGLILSAGMIRRFVMLAGSIFAVAVVGWPSLLTSKTNAKSDISEANS